MVLVTHDTGPLHLGGLTRVGIVTLFGPVDPHGRLPQRAGALALWGGEDFACRPCYDGRSFAACPQNDCIRQYTPMMVAEEVTAMLAERARGYLCAAPGKDARAVRTGWWGLGECMDRALFLDRDGVINEEVGYLYRAEEVRFVPGIFALCRTAQALGYRLIVVTNQSGIAREFYTTEDFETLMTWMRGEFAREGVTLDAVYHCPYHPEQGVGKWKREHEDRKPGPGMLLRGAREFGLELGQCVMVGDRCGDVGAANAAGLRQAFLVPGTEPDGCSGEYLAVGSLAEVEEWLRKEA